MLQTIIMIAGFGGLVVLSILLFQCRTRENREVKTRDSMFPRSSGGGGNKETPIK